jgi:hypothetical protein
MLQFLAIPYIEAYVERDAAESVLDPRIKFPRSVKEEVISSYLETQSKYTNGDPIAILDLLMKGYNMQYTNAKKDMAKIVKTITQAAAAACDATDAEEEEQAKAETHAVVLTAIKNDTHKANTTEFAAMVDSVYKKAMEDCHDWSCATSYLLSDKDIMHIYNLFQSRFPLVHMTLACIVSTKYYSVPFANFAMVDDNTDEDDDDDPFDVPVLHKKQRMILFVNMIICMRYACTETRSCHLAYIPWHFSSTTCGPSRLETHYW